MFPRHLFHRAFAFGACGAAIVVSANGAAAAKGQRACMPAYEAYKSALEREEAGHLREARALLLTCNAAPAACSGLVQKCTASYKQLGSAMSTVVPLVTDDTGAPRVDVQVKIDGDLLTPQLDGKGLPVDIGLHEFTFSTEAGVFATQRALILEGQRNRVLSVVLHGTADSTAPKPDLSAGTSAAVAEASGRPGRPPSAEPAAERPNSDKPAPNEPPASAQSARDAERDRVPSDEVPLREGAAKGAPAPPQATHRSALPAYLLGGVGLVGLGAGTLLTLWGRNDNDLLAQCKPNCKQSSVDHVRTLYIASDVSFGAGVVALGAATWLFVRSWSTDSPKSPAAALAHFEVAPSSSGAVAWIKGNF